MIRTKLMHGVKYSAFSIMLLLSACHSTGNTYDAQQIANLEPGVSTMNDAVEMLAGSPVNYYYRPDGSYVARWARVSSAVPDGLYLKKEHMLEFDANHRFIRLVP